MMKIIAEISTCAELCMLPLNVYEYLPYLF